MKIIQIISNYSGTGATAYLIALHNELCNQGHDTQIFHFGNCDTISFDTISLNVIHKEINQATFNEINAADIVLINGLPHKKENKEYQLAYIDMLQNKIKIKKALFLHSHYYRSWVSANCANEIMNKEFLMSMNKICGFVTYNEVLNKIENIIGKDELDKRFVHILLPNVFDKSLWIDANEKQKKISYFGRLVGFKDPERFIEMRDNLWNNGWQMEMRGVVRSIGALQFKNLCRKFDEFGKMTNEPSDATLFMTGKLKEKYGCDKKDELCLNLNSNERKIFVFGRYHVNDGMKVMAQQAFGVDFFNLKNNAYGDTVEYAIYDIIKCGTIPVLDLDMAKQVHLYDDNGNRLDKTLYDVNAGIFIKKDLSNVQEAIQQMNDLYNDKSKYDEFRENCYNIYKEFANPNRIVKILIDDIMRG